MSNFKVLTYCFQQMKLVKLWISFPTYVSPPSYSTETFQIKDKEAFVQDWQWLAMDYHYLSGRLIFICQKKIDHLNR